MNVCVFTKLDSKHENHLQIGFQHSGVFAKLFMTAPKSFRYSSYLITVGSTPDYIQLADIGQGFERFLRHQVGARG